MVGDRHPARHCLSALYPIQADELTRHASPIPQDVAYPSDPAIAYQAATGRQSFPPVLNISTRSAHADNSHSRRISPYHADSAAVPARHPDAPSLRSELGNAARQLLPCYPTVQRTTNHYQPRPQSSSAVTVPSCLAVPPYLTCLQTWKVYARATSFGLLQSRWHLRSRMEGMPRPQCRLLLPSIA